MADSRDSRCRSALVHFLLVFSLLHSILTTMKPGQRLFVSLNWMPNWFVSKNWFDSFHSSTGHGTIRRGTISEQNILDRGYHIHCLDTSCLRRKNFFQFLIISFWRVVLESYINIFFRYETRFTEMETFLTSSYF